MTAWLAALLLLQVADMLTTLRALRRPGRREANPWLAWLMARIGEAPALLLVKGALVAALVAWHAQIPTAMMIGLVALYAVVVANNLRRIWKNPRA